MAQAARRGRPSTGAREAVLRAAGEMLGDAGLALSTKEIAHRAGVAESSIFYHFGDRRGLIQAVIGQYLPVFADTTAVLGERPAPPADGGPAGDPDLQADLAAMLTGLEDFYRRIMPILGAMQSGRTLRDLLVAHGGEIGPHLALRPVGDALRVHQAAGRLAAGLDPVTGALLLIGAAHQRALYHYLLGDDADRFVPPVETVARTLLPTFAP
ncbi:MULTISPECIES: helix-turn-helix domain-containing protein [unclassified Streptomyces]|uniref:TetR/AcrR family transcriptional regulator n=1 Tax=Streptomycetaceae TaxID=2062 RepID=UPI002E762C62|nr:MULTISPECIES: helix-turn-helix domain-containing protein [unclassified Streptomyces]MED7954280.1 helix-turn-helix domain containing protein [Streptomyces sp. BE303]MEE1825763.1 helix-turn-helix domain containing protein [Streptomyces sp. BE20]